MSRRWCGCLRSGCHLGPIIVRQRKLISLRWGSALCLCGAHCNWLLMAQQRSCKLRLNQLPDLRLIGSAGLRRQTDKCLANVSLIWRTRCSRVRCNYRHRRNRLRLVRQEPPSSGLVSATASASRAKLSGAHWHGARRRRLWSFALHVRRRWRQFGLSQ